MTWEWPLRTSLGLSWSKFHRIIVSSEDPDANWVPSSCILRHRTQSPCPINVFLQYPDATSQSLSVLSLDALNKKSPLGRKATSDTLCSCPWRVSTQVYCERSHKRIVKSLEDEAMSFPLGANATEFTVPVWPFKARSNWPLSKSQRRIDPSSELVARIL